MVKNQYKSGRKALFKADLKILHERLLHISKMRKIRTKSLKLTSKTLHFI